MSARLTKLLSQGPDKDVVFVQIAAKMIDKAAHGDFGVFADTMVTLPGGLLIMQSSALFICNLECLKVTDKFFEVFHEFWRRHSRPRRSLASHRP